VVRILTVGGRLTSHDFMSASSAAATCRRSHLSCPAACSGADTHKILWAPCPFSPQKRTFGSLFGMPAKCQSRHFALQEKQRPFSASDHHELGDRPAKRWPAAFARDDASLSL